MSKILIKKKDVALKILHAHKIVGNIEWTGIILYKPEKPLVLNEPNIINVNDIFITHIGNSAYFNYITDDTIKVSINSPYIMDNMYGLIHTHHSMGASFSPTDMEELTKEHNLNIYLSLVVDYRGTYVAKLAILIDEYNVSYKDEFGNLITTKINKRYSFVEDLKVIIEGEDANFTEHLTTLLKNRPETVRTYNDTFEDFHKTFPSVAKSIPANTKKDNKFSTISDAALATILNGNAEEFNLYLVVSKISELLRNKEIEEGELFMHLDQLDIYIKDYNKDHMTNIIYKDYVNTLLAKISHIKTIGAQTIVKHLKK